MWAHSLQVEDYDDLLNRGWRRSGIVFIELVFTIFKAVKIKFTNNDSHLHLKLTFYV